ncbi:AraC family transcriptional regulator [uncultured Dietzia sp.]|uniref:AraC family transcriptional regulator n=1 Tax=uncultured Dietzia sp. TaxID=395519 RepID=UPI0025FB256F|nr:AraC family transcriptional regulator [uncultured Dietzia sp.]
MQPLIRAASLRGFDALVIELGGDPARLLERFDIAADVLEHDDGLLSITAHDRMLDAAAAELYCPDLGLRLAERQDLTILGPVARAVSTSATATEALDAAARFLFVHSPVLTIGVDDDPWGRRGVVALTYRKEASESPYSPQAVELGLGVFYRVAVQLLGRSTGLRSVEIPHGPLSPVDRYLDFFSADVKFDRPVAALCVDARVLDSAFETADEEIRRAAVDHLSGAYSDPADSIATQIRRIVSERLPGPIPSLSEVSRTLHLHPRTLQRRLVVVGTSFGQIVDDLRRDRAHRYITTTDLSFTQIADLVGFAEQATLSHAVRRWFGVSPRRLRHQPRLSR